MIKNLDYKLNQNNNADNNSVEVEVIDSNNSDSDLVPAKPIIEN